MILYSAALSLFAKKVEIALHEKGLAFERILVPFTQAAGYTPKHPKVLEVNPKGQVPVLIDGSLQLYDSTVILEYLEDAYPHPPLYPKDPAARARCRLMELHADEIMLPAVRALMHRTGPRPAEAGLWEQWEAAAAGATEQLRAHFQALDDALRDRDVLFDGMSVADIAAFMMVLYAVRLGGPGIRRYPNLERWFRHLAARPAFSRIVADIQAADRDLSESVEQDGENQAP